MADHNANGRTLWALGLALGAALLVIAFLLGRESGRSAPFAEPEVADTRADEEETTGNEQSTEPAGGSEPHFSWRTERKGDAPFSWEVEAAQRRRDAAVGTSTTGPARIEQRPNGTIVLSNVNKKPTQEKRPTTQSRVTRTTPTPSEATSTDAYFAKLDAVRSEQEATNPKAFAMGLLRSAMSGSTEGFEKLLADTERMEQELREITPPPTCAQYHQATLDALDESRAVLEELKDAMMRQDIDEITRVAHKARALQAKTTELQAMEKELRAQ